MKIKDLNARLRGAMPTHRILTAVVMLLFGSSMTRCASIGSPTGGPKDTVPPVVLAIHPQDYSTRFDGKNKRIYIDFNEYVQLKDQ